MSGNTVCFLASLFPSLCITVSEFRKYLCGLCDHNGKSPIHFLLSWGHLAISHEVPAAKCEKFLGEKKKREKKIKKVPLVKHGLGQKERHSQLMIKNRTLAANLVKSSGIKPQQLCRADLRCYDKPPASGQGHRHDSAKGIPACRAGIANKVFEGNVAEDKTRGKLAEEMLSHMGLVFRDQSVYQSTQLAPFSRSQWLSKTVAT